MTLLKCPSCKTKVSSEATACPKCGHPLDQEWREKGVDARKREKRRIRIFLAIVALWAIWITWPSDRQRAIDPAVQAVGTHLTGAMNVDAGDLRTRPNPNGEGFFVFAPETRYAGVERLFVWFVKGDTVMKLNGATDALTPDLPFPRHASANMWEGTGLNPKSATRVGLKVAFGR